MDHPVDPTPGAAAAPRWWERGDGVEMVVVGYRSRGQVEELLAGLPDALPLVVVDNSDGADGLEELVATRPASRYLRGGGVGFARAANLGARSSTAEVLLLLNPDTRPTEAQLEALVDDVRADTRCAAVSAVLVDADGRSQIGVAGWEPSLRRAAVHAAGLHKVFPRAGLAARPAPGEHLHADWVSCGCTAVRRDTFAALGYFDEGFYVYNEDVALGRAARARGLTVKLRTDLPVTSGSGGSGAPSLEMMRLRGAALNRYVRRYRPAAAAAALNATVAAGYAGRAAACWLARRTRRAGEHWAQALGAATGTATVAGRPVSLR